MSAVAEVLSSDRAADDHQAGPRGSERRTCTVCADTMVAAEASAFVADGVVSYLWTCETCGYGFVTKHTMKRSEGI